MREKEGSVLQSNEIGIAVGVLAAFCALMLLGKFLLTTLMKMMQDYISKVGEAYEPTQEFFQKNALEMTKYCIIMVLPVALILGAVAVIVVMAQTKGLFNTKMLKPKFSRLNPITGFKRLFSLQSVVGIVKGIIELAIIGILVYNEINGRLVKFGQLTDMEPIQGIYYTADSIFSITMTIVIVLVFVAAADYVFQWWQFEKKLKMSKQEVKDEYKQMEGDPQIKGKIKQKQREISQQRMMEQVPSADVVVRNPTHYAVALKYEPTDAFSAPRVVAKGQDALALKIVALAEENNVYITENRPLARALYDSVKVGDAIPVNMYVAVAEVLSEMFNKKGVKPKMVVPEKGARPKIKRSDLGR